MSQCRTGSSRCYGVPRSEGARSQVSPMARPKPIAPNGEQVAHNIMDREEPLGLCRRFEAAHVALAARFFRKLLKRRAQRAAIMLTPRASALMALFGLKYPIFSAGMGTTAVPELAIAVSNAGGLGAVGTGLNPTADLVRQRVSKAKSATDRPFAVNILLARDHDALPVALDVGAPIIQFAWGIPTAEEVAAVRKAGAKMGIQIGSAAGARRALDLGTDYLICQGIEAGGHVQGTSALYEVLPAVIDAAQTVPVLAGGGIATGRTSCVRFWPERPGCWWHALRGNEGSWRARGVQVRNHSGQGRRHRADRLLPGPLGQCAASRAAQPDA
jgi:hypothetical protein